MIIAVSDIHLGYEKSDEEEFLKFLRSDILKLTKKDSFVLLGDIFEFWRGQNVKAVLENPEILKELNKINKRTNVYYITGNHDYSILNLSQKNEKNYPFKVTKNKRLKSNNTTFYFVHGYELEVFAKLEPISVEDYETASLSLCDRTEEITGFILGNLWTGFKKITKVFSEAQKLVEYIEKPPEKRKNTDDIEELAKSPEGRGIFLGMKENEFLVFGHTHRPFCKNELKVANTGSWVKGNENKFNTFIQIDSGKAELRQWQQGKSVKIE